MATVGAGYFTDVPCPFSLGEACRQPLTILVTPGQRATPDTIPEQDEIEVSGCPHVDEATDDDWPEIEARLWKVVRERKEA